MKSFVFAALMALTLGTSCAQSEDNVKIPQATSKKTVAG